MKILRFAFILILGTVFTPAFMLAQRGGGHGGGGGGHSVGGGGGVRMGGGVSGGGMARPGGFSGGSALRGSPGVAGGAFRGGVNGGFNRGFGGVNRGFGGFNRGYFGFGFGFGYPFYGYPFYGYPYYGYGYGYPGYYDDGYYPYDSGYGYGYSDPYAYNSYGDNGNGYPSQAPAYNQPPGSPSYEPMPPTPGSSTESFYRRPDYYLIAFNDHTIQAALTYHVEGDQIYWTTREHEERHAPIVSVDRRFTEQMNRDRRVDMRLP
jgi:hypothetical protein